MSKPCYNDVDEIATLVDLNAARGYLDRLTEERAALDAKISRQRMLIDLLSEPERPGSEPQEAVREPNSEPDGEPSGVEAQAEDETAPSGQDGANGRVAGVVARKLILNAMETRPDHAWSAKDLRAALDDTGILDEGGTPFRRHLFDLRRSGDIVQVTTGVHRLRRPEDVAADGSVRIG